jgi:hypothetical protein
MQPSRRSSSKIAVIVMHKLVIGTKDVNNTVPKVISFINKSFKVIIAVAFTVKTLQTFTTSLQTASRHLHFLSKLRKSTYPVFTFTIAFILKFRKMLEVFRK